MIANQDFMVFDENMERIGFFKNPRSLSWVEHYQDIGKMQIIADDDEHGDNRFLLRESNILWRKGTETAMEILSVEFNMKDKKIIAGGKSTTCLFTDRRPFIDEFPIMNVERDLYTAMSESMQGGRNLEHFAVSEVSGLTETFETTVKGESLGQIMNIIKQADLGFKTIFDPYSKTHTFKIYKGTDKSYGGSDAPVVFSNDTGFKNLVNVTVFKDKSIYKNTAVVTGQTEGNNTARVIVGDENTGSGRYELFVDGTGVERKLDVRTVWDSAQEAYVPIYVPRPLDDPEYLSRLEALGKTELQKHQIVETFEAEIIMENTDEWAVGDIVTVKWVRLQKDGSNIRSIPELIKNIRIMSLEFIIENGFTKHKITIGNPAITIFTEMEMKG